MNQPAAAPVVLVTGAGRRVGAEIARHLHAAGARLALHCRHSRSDADALAATFDAARPGSALVVQADLLEVAALAGVVEATVAHFGRLDALVNNASSFFPTAMGEIDEAAWLDLIGSNLKAPLFLAQAANPWLQASGGAIVNIVDIHAERPLKGYPLYCAAKAGLLGLTRALALTERAGQNLWRHLQPFTKRFLPARTPAQAFPLGLLWGWLPCGLVYSALVTALTTGSPGRGALAMAAFGLGTLPNLLLAGMVIGRLGEFVRRPWVRNLSGLLVLAFGVYGLFAWGRLQSSL